jgi:acyl carrier protein
MPIDSETADALESLNDQIRTIISRVSRIATSELEETVNVREELGIDSLMAMEIIATCEKRFGITIDEREYLTIETIGDFLRLVERLVRGKGAH